MKRAAGWGIVCLLAGAAMWAAGAEPPDEKPVMLFPVIKGGKWGYMDEKGAVAIEPQYDAAFDFSEGLACVAKGLFRGYIDRTGKMVIEPRYGLSGRFSCGYARVLGPPTGKEWSGKNLWGDDLQLYQSGLRYYYCDREGTTHAPGFNADFSEGKACSGKECIGTDFKKVTHDASQLGRFSDGLVVASKDKKWGYMDHSMKWVIEPAFETANEFGEGLAAVGYAKEGGADKKKSRTRSYTWGFVDKTGKVVLEPKWHDAWKFTEGLAAVRVGEKWGYIDREGKTVIEPAYDFAWEFSEGKGRVLVGEKHGYVDTTGTLVIPARFDAGWEFSKGLCRVGIGTKEGYINHEGAYVWEPTE